MRFAWRPRASRSRRRPRFSLDAFRQNEDRFKSKPDAALKYVSARGISARSRRRRQRAGRVHQRDEPDPQPERNGDEGVVMDQRFDVPLNLTRRRFLGTGRPRHRRGRARRSCCSSTSLAQSADGVAAGADGWSPGTAAFCAEGQARHLHVPERRPVAARSVRLQAAARQGAGHRPARFDPERPALDGDDRGADELSDRAIDLQVRAARAIGRVAQ